MLWSIKMKKKIVFLSYFKKSREKPSKYAFEMYPYLNIGWKKVFCS